MNNKRMRILLIIQIISLIFTVSIVGGILYYYLDRKHIPEQLNTISERVKILESENKELNDKIDSINTDIYVPKKNVDFFDGKDGRDGEDSVSTHTIEKETVIEKVPINGVDGYTPIIRCNEDKNRWEYKVSVIDNWQLLNNEVVKCTIKGE